MTELNKYIVRSIRKTLFFYCIDAANEEEAQRIAVNLNQRDVLGDSQVGSTWFDYGVSPNNGTLDIKSIKLTEEKMHLLDEEQRKKRREENYAEIEKNFPIIVE
jgi:hypothetical protein